MSEKQKGLTVDILRRGGGAHSTLLPSNKHDKALLVGDGVDGPFEPKDGELVLVLVRRDIGGEYLHAVPEGMQDRMLCFGGNYCDTSDSRFPNRYPIPIHDDIHWNDKTGK